MKKEKLIKMEEELSNEKLAQIIGGVSSSKISVTFSMASQPELSEASSGKDNDVTISMASQPELSEASSGKDKDSDADESLKIVEPLK